MMDAREGALVAIGDAATYAHIKNKIAPAAEKPSAPMRANGAAAPTAPLAVVSNGTKSHHGTGGDSSPNSPNSPDSRRMTLLIVRSGRQSSASMALPSH